MEEGNLEKASTIFVAIIFVHIWICLMYLFTILDLDNSGIKFVISLPFSVSAILVTLRISINQLELYVQRKVRKTGLDLTSSTHHIVFYKHYSGEKYE